MWSASHHFILVPPLQVDNFHQIARVREPGNGLLSAFIDDYLFTPSRQGVSRTILIPDSAHGIPLFGNVGLVAVDQSPFVDLAAKLHAGIGFFTEHPELEFQLKVSYVPALPGDEIVLRRQMPARRFASKGAILHGPKAHVWRFPAVEGFAIENRLPTLR